MQLTEPGLCVVTDPMKSVTKLGRSANAAPLPPLPMSAEEGPSGPVMEGMKRKYREALEEQSTQLQQLQQTQADILLELQGLVTLAGQRARAGGSMPGDSQ